MSGFRRTLIACTALMLSASADAQTLKSGTLSLVVPFAAGGPSDVAGRILAQGLTDVLGQTVVVENPIGGGGTVGSLRVSRGTPDGSHFVLGNNGTHSWSQSLYKTPPYETLRDFTPLGLAVESPRVIIVPKDLPANTLPEFVAYVKANQDKIQFASAGAGSASHVSCILLNAMLGVNVTHVPYRGEGPALQDVIADRIDYMCTTIQSGAAQARNGSVKGIAVMSPRRAAVSPDLATTGEQGVPGVEATVWNGFFFPKGTPKPIVDKMHKAIETVIAKPDIRQKMEALGLEILPPEQRTPEYLAKFLKEDVERWGKVIKDAGISVE